MQENSQCLWKVTARSLKYTCTFHQKTAGQGSWKRRKWDSSNGIEEQPWGITALGDQGSDEAWVWGGSVARGQHTDTSLPREGSLQGCSVCVGLTSQCSSASCEQPSEHKEFRVGISVIQDNDALFSFLLRNWVSLLKICDQVSLELIDADSAAWVIQTHTFELLKQQPFIFVCLLGWFGFLKQGLEPTL